MYVVDNVKTSQEINTVPNAVSGRTDLNNANIINAIARRMISAELWLSRLIKSANQLTRDHLQESTAKASTANVVCMSIITAAHMVTTPETRIAVIIETG